MATDPEKCEIEAEVAAELGNEQLSTGHLPVEGEAPRGNVHGDEDDGAAGDVPPPHGH